MTKEEVRARIVELAIVPAVRAANDEDALFAAEAVSRGGLPIVELTMTVPKATELIAHLVKKHPHMVVGAGTVLDVETARLSGCWGEIHYQSRAGSGSRQVRGPGGSHRNTRGPDAERNHSGCKSRRRLRQNLSLLPGGRRGLPPRLEISVPQSIVYRGGRRESANRGAIPGGWSDRRGHWRRPDPAARYHHPRGTLD
jgi:hypothetical protein